MLIKNRITLVIINLILCAKTFTNDFNAKSPEDCKSSFPKICATFSKIKSFVVEHPKESAIVAGVLIAGASLSFSELLQRQHEGLDGLKTYSRPGMATMPFQHGVKPYFLGTIAGGVAGVYLQKCLIRRSSLRLLKKTEDLKCQASITKTAAKQHLDKVTSISHQASGNLNSANKSAEQSAVIVQQARQIEFQIAGMYQSLDEIDRQSQITFVAQQGCFLASFYGFGKVIKGWDHIENQIHQQQLNLDRCITSGQTLKHGIDYASDTIQDTQASLNAAGDSINLSKQILIRNKRSLASGDTGVFGDK